ncbi:MAG: family 78 glycoside hydrolase catalytic domain [Anaerolineaceae bacterium]
MIQAINLKTEYLIDPIGIDIKSPRLFWNVAGGKKQTAYSLVLKTCGEVVWKSGKVFSNHMRADYAGPALSSRQRVEWSVRLWDENDDAGDESSAFFEMGLLDSSDWLAKWITADLVINKKRRYPVDCFQKEFRVSKAVKQARLYITACGLYMAYLNGEKAGDAELTPGYTDYRKRLQYQTYDVTCLVRTGDNWLEVELADGWYRGCIGSLSYRNVFGTRTQLLIQIELDYGDGTRDTIGSDESFAWSNDGPIIYSDLKNGEIVDVNRKPGYGGKARLGSFPVTPSASNNVLIKQQERFTPTLIIAPSGAKILDFGQNMAGFIGFRLKGEKGQVLTLKLGEVLDHGEFTQVNFQSGSKEYIAQKIQFTCSGSEDVYRTKFAIFGFRYALVEGLESINPQDFCAIAVYSALEETGDFRCSNGLINQLVKNTRWSMKSNFADVPTDCPTRERAPWTGDAQIFCNTANYLMNAAPFFRKWLNDLTDRQTKDGKVHSIVPTVGNETLLAAVDGGVGWGDAVIFIPYRCYQIYRDEAFLRHHYPSMKAFAEFSIRRAAQTFVTNWFRKNPYKKYTYDCYQHFGEWCEPQGVEPYNLIINIIFPRPEEATAYFSYQMHCMSKAASILGLEEDCHRYAEYADGAKKAYNYLFVKNNTIDTDRQAKLVRPLALGLLDGEVMVNVQNRLEQALGRNEYRVGTGFLSTPFLLPVLTAAEKLDIAFKVLENEESPGWLYGPKQGATTIWENWEGYDAQGHPKSSHNHYAFGAVCEWLFDTIGGIRIIGEKEFLIKPHFGGSLTFAQTRYQSIFGEVVSDWELVNEEFSLVVIIPGNCTATIILPNSESHRVESGVHRYTVPL